MRFQLVWFLLLASTTTTYAQTSLKVLAKCDSPQGYVYTYSGGLVPESQSGWSRDAISKGSMTFVVDGQQNYDVIWTDATQRTTSASNDGARVALVGKTSKAIVIMTLYPSMLVETYFLKFLDQRKAVLSWGQARFGDEALVQKHGLMVAECRAD